MWNTPHAGHAAGPGLPAPELPAPEPPAREIPVQPMPKPETPPPEAPVPDQPEPVLPHARDPVPPKPKGARCGRRREAHSDGRARTGMEVRGPACNGPSMGWGVPDFRPNRNRGVAVTFALSSIR